jgi:hypothetical protein
MRPSHCLGLRAKNVQSYVFENKIGDSPDPYSLVAKKNSLVDVGAQSAKVCVDGDAGEAEKAIFSDAVIFNGVIMGSLLRRRELKTARGKPNGTRDVTRHMPKKEEEENAKRFKS